jgi:hypothetical protein
MYLLGTLFIRSFVLVFILTLLLLSVDFYYLKNIAGRRLVGLRWWNEVNTATGESHWVFETSEGTGRVINATDKRFFWLSMYVAPVAWVGLGVLALVRMVGVIWLVIVGEYFLLEVLGPRSFRPRAPPSGCVGCEADMRI